MSDLSFRLKEVASHTLGISSAKTLSCVAQKVLQPPPLPGAVVLLEVKDFTSQRGGVCN